MIRTNGRKSVHDALEKVERERGDIVAPRTKIVTLEVVGIGEPSILKVHQMTEKTRKQIEEAQIQKSAETTIVKKPRRAPKDPWAEFVDAAYVLPGKTYPFTAKPVGSFFPPAKDTFGFPCKGIGAGIKDVLKGYGYSPMERRAVWVIGDLMPLKYDKLWFKAVPCRVGPYKTADYHYPHIFLGWSGIISIRYDEDVISLTQVVNAANRAGLYCGLGEERPSSPKNQGTYGMYQVRQTK